jgi:methionyl-tRNA formyltransferase
MPFKIGLLGSTQHTINCTQFLLDHPQFEVSWVLTPAPKPRGRKKELVPNPVQTWALKSLAPTVLIESQIDESVEKSVREIIGEDNRPDFLIVVDFGYKLPGWLIDLPKIMAINVHPSALPRWRGSSPGQFVLLHGEKKTTISVITLAEEFDQGDIIFTKTIPVDSSWTQTEYYQTCFDKISPELPHVLEQLANKKVIAQAQPASSPTPLARKLTKDDGFIDWANIGASLVGKTKPTTPLNPLLQKAYESLQDTDSPLSQLIEQAVRAFSPWPHVWTVIETKNGQKRMQILETSIDESGKLSLEKVQIEGKQPTTWNQIKNILESSDT